MTVNEAPGKETRLVVFEVGTDTYGLNASVVQRVILAKRVSRKKDATGFVEGVINFKGGVIPIVDLRKRFSFAAIAQNKYDHVILVSIYGQEIGLLVDAVIGVLRTFADFSETLDLTGSIADWDYLFGIDALDGKQMRLLDLDHLFSKEEKILLLKTIGENDWIL